MSTGKRVTISLHTKYEIIKCFEDKVKISEIKERFKLKDRKNVHVIIKNKEKIKQKYQNMKKKDVKTSSYVRDSNFPLVENALVISIQQMRSQKANLSGPTIKSKAIEFANKLNVQNFKANDGYIVGLKKRYNLEYRIESGESFSVDQDSITRWISKLPEIINNYEMQNIFNLDETGLFWKLLSNKTYAFSNESRHGIKQHKNRVTLTMICNANGSEKKLIMIGSSVKPRCFRQVKTLPIDYYNQKNTWMDSSIFRKIVFKLNDKMKKQNRKILLFLDNCSSYFINEELSNVKLIYFPSNSASVLQPLDLGIIKCLKTNYRKKINFLLNIST